MDTGSQPGGILTVLELLDSHKAAMVYDFRHRFGFGPRDFGAALPWDEVVSLVAVLLSDPTSWLQTSKNKWDHPVDFNWTLTAATYDLLAQVNSKRKPQPWPRPWPTSDRNRIGRARKDARDILAKIKDGDIEWQSKPTPM